MRFGCYAVCIKGAFCDAITEPKDYDFKSDEAGRYIMQNESWNEFCGLAAILMNCALFAADLTLLGTMQRIVL